MGLIEKIETGIKHVLENEEMTPFAREDLKVVLSYVEKLKESVSA